MNAHNMHFLLGNHETMMLHVAASDGSVTPNLNKFQGRREINWLFQNGGAITYHRYRLLRKKERKELLKWLNSCPVSTKVDASLEGWYLNEELSTESKVQFPYVVTGDVTLYAKWRPVQCTITYYANGATSGTVPAAVTVDKGSSILLNRFNTSSFSNFSSKNCFVS